MFSDVFSARTKARKRNADDCYNVKPHLHKTQCYLPVPILFFLYVFYYLSLVCCKSFLCCVSLKCLNKKMVWFIKYFPTLILSAEIFNEECLNIKAVFQKL